MARVSIIKAAKLAGIARSHLYKAYINTGLLSLSKDEKNRPYIDTSELLRVFGTLTEDTPKTGQKTVTEDNTGQSEKTAENDLQDQQNIIKKLEEQLTEAKDREEWYQSQIQSLTDTMKLLEGPKQHPHFWWQFWK